jgi:hypothetical protein
MNEQEKPPETLANYLFTLLGGVCAVVVGIAYFGEQNSRSPASVGTSPEIQWLDVRSDQSILD